MKNDELNQYILHYLTKDKTKSAIMLTGGWGTGKSHYIQNSLIPFLTEEKNGKHQCIVVSLYSLKDTAEISKAIYMECRVKFFKPASEGMTTGLFVGKSIVKGVTSFFGVDLSKSDADMQELYESVDLSGKLIILEDLERSGVDILDVMGYVNNLVEQDGVKVLLVANEQEIIVTEEKTEEDGKGNSQVVRVNTEHTTKYLRTKEKTVTDTIHYEEDFTEAIQQIIRSFDNAVLNKFASSESAKDVTDIMLLCNSWNLRSFIFACQKASDIFSKMDDCFTSDDDFIQVIFFGILFYVFRVKGGQKLRWGREKLFSTELGHERYPLLKFCYDYLDHQVIDTSNVQAVFDEVKKLELFDKSKSNSDPDISTIRSWYVHSEDSIIKALQNIKRRLETDITDISFYVYGDIAVYSIIIKDLLNVDIDDIKRLLVENLKGKGNELYFESLFRTDIGSSAGEGIQEEFKNLSKEMHESLLSGQGFFSNFEYSPENASELYNVALKNREKFETQGSFICNLDVNRLAEMFFQCSPEQKEDIRGAFLTVYRMHNLKFIYEADYEGIKELLVLLKEQQNRDVGDRIQQTQYQWFIEKLTDICEKLA